MINKTEQLPVLAEPRGSFTRQGENNETGKIFSHSIKNCEGEIKQSHMCDEGSSGCWGQRKLHWEGDAEVQFCLR